MKYQGLRIFEADKGGAVVVMDRTYCADKILNVE